MSSKDDSGFTPRTESESDPAEYVTFLEHWASEFPTPPLVEREPDPSDPAPFAAAAVPPPIPIQNAREEPPAEGPPPAQREEPATRPALPPLRLPRRREETETLRVHLAPEQLYWARLAAARAGSKVDESTLVAAGLALLEQRGLDWRAIRSRGDLRAALALPPSPNPQPTEP